jgi:hypothetical protein
MKLNHKGLSLLLSACFNSQWNTKTLLAKYGDFRKQYYKHFEINAFKQKKFC